MRLRTRTTFTPAKLRAFTWMFSPGRNTRCRQLNSTWSGSGKQKIMRYTAAPWLGWMNRMAEQHIRSCTIILL